MPTLYQRLGLRPFINARGTITTLGGSIMPAPVVEAMAEASRQFVHLNELHEKAGARIAELTGAEAAFVSSGAAGGMLLAGAACLTGTDARAIAQLPDVGDRPNQFVISLVDSHFYVHQGFCLSGGELVKVGTTQAVTIDDYVAGIGPKTAAVVYFLGSQPLSELPALVAAAHERNVPVIVDAAAQLPPRSNLTDLPAMGCDLSVFSGGKGLFGPQSSGLILGRKDLIAACHLNSNPHSAIGRGMKVGKEEICGLLRAVELFFEMDEAAVVAEWERRCRVVAEAVEGIAGIEASFTKAYENKFPPASPLVHLHFGDAAPLLGQRCCTRTRSRRTVDPRQRRRHRAQRWAANPLRRRSRKHRRPPPTHPNHRSQTMTEDKTTLTAAEVDAELQTLAGWSRDGIIISRDFVFTNFKDITSFLNHLTRTITEQNHHPDFSLDTGKRTIAVSVTTHSEGAVTRSDILFARTLNEWQPGS